MEKNIEGHVYLDHLGETLKRRENFRAVSLDHRFRCVACFNGMHSSWLCKQQCEATTSTKKSGFRRLT